MEIACWSACQLTCYLQSVLNAAARLVYHLKARDHIIDALISLQLNKHPTGCEAQLQSIQNAIRVHFWPVIVDP